MTTSAALVVISLAAASAGAQTFTGPSSKRLVPE
jgi:hypothetical protein